MNSRTAHRDGDRFDRCAALRRLWSGLFCLALGLAGPAFAACGSPAGTARVVDIDDRLEIALEDGRVVRLGGLDAPGPERGAPETAKAARDFLTARLVGREAELSLMAGGTDRWGRVVADLAAPETPGGSPGSIASALLAAGFARVRPEFEARGCSPLRLAIEDRARRAGLGIWRDPEYAVIKASDAAELQRRDGQFVVVVGRVRRVGFGRSRLYLDLAPLDGPTIVVARKLEPAFGRAGRPVGALVGQTIRARGALDNRFGPRIEVGEVAMIEFLRPSEAFGEAKPRQ
jgi:endonuclease YncB( thermonuclease family)